MLHKDIPVGADSSHPPGYVQAGDPGAVGANKVWVDTSAGTGLWVKKIRNAANTAWETLGASASHVHAAADITSGTMATARLGSGTANATTFLRGDQSWQVPGSGGGVAIVFKGTGGQYVSVPTNAAFDIASPSKFTVRMWIMPLGNSTNHGLATRSSLASSQGDWALGFFNGASMRPTFRVNNNAASVQSATTLSPGEEYFIEASYDSSLGSNNLKLFIDGVLDVQGNYSTVITNNANPIRVGTYFDGSSWFSGYISEFEFCANFIRNTAGYTPPTQITPDANTTIHWSFDEYFGAGVTDDSGNGFNGSIVSPADYNTYFRKL